jgi:hypothetical protein
MKSKFTITDFSPPPQKKKRRLTMKEFMQLQKKKRGKVKILYLKKKKRGFMLNELSSQPVMRKKIKYNTSPPKNTHNSPPKNTHNSPPKNTRTAHQMQHRLTNTKFTIDDAPSSPKQVKHSNTKFTIDDIPSPKQSSSLSSHNSSSSHNKHEPISPTPCCACKRVLKEGDKTHDDCVWCQLKFHLNKCTKKNATERKRETRKQLKPLIKNMKRITI